jgi:hypothetical protein
MTRKRRQQERLHNIVLVLNGANDEDVPLLVFIENALAESVLERRQKILREFERRLIYTRTIERSVREKIPPGFVHVGRVGMFLIEYNDKKHEALIII